MHKAKRIGFSKYEYRGFIVEDTYCNGWQIVLRDAQGWVASANTLRQAKARIDNWYEARQTGKRIVHQKFVEAVERVLADACERGELVDCPDEHLCRHGIDN